jgi:hypothetical protein
MELACNRNAPLNGLVDNVFAFPLIQSLSIEQIYIKSYIHFKFKELLKKEMNKHLS